MRSHRNAGETIPLAPEVDVSVRSKRLALVILYVRRAPPSEVWHGHGSSGKGNTTITIHNFIVNPPRSVYLFYPSTYIGGWMRRMLPHSRRELPHMHRTGRSAKKARVSLLLLRFRRYAFIHDGFGSPTASQLLHGGATPPCNVCSSGSKVIRRTLTR